MRFALGLALGCCVCAFAKENAPAGPFQQGSLLKRVSTLPMTTAEITAYMPGWKTLFVVGGEKVMEVVDIGDPASPKLVNTLSLPGGASSVTVHGNLVAVSLLADPEWKRGHVQVMRYGDRIETLSVTEVCNQPDMITFTPDGKNLLVACEGSPDADFREDPEGGIAILSIDSGATWKNPRVTVAGFAEMDSSALMAEGVRKAGVQGFFRSLEPEYITVSADSRTAWVSLQENNAIAVLDVVERKVTDIFPLGYVDHAVPGFALDLKSDSKVNIANYPVRGLRQPDGIYSFTVGDRPFVVTANEGAPVNDYKAWTDVTTPLVLAQQGRLDPKVFDGGMLDELGRFTVSNLERCDVPPDIVPGGRCPYVYGFGSRSVSIFDGVTGMLVWDSGDMLERAFAKIAPDYFNWNSKKKKVKMDSRSDAKGCEPENVTVGEVGGNRYAFVGLERAGAVAVFDVSDMGRSNNPSPALVDLYLDPSDRGPEGILFIPAEKSPNGNALLVVGYEYSKTLTIYQVK